MQPRLYLDIDGVLLHKRGGMPAADLEPFLDTVLHDWDCYWLTTHCKSPQDDPVPYLLRHLGAAASLLEIRLRRIKPVEWDTLKTEGIDLRSPFFWLDDAPFESEIRVLEGLGLAHRLIRVNLAQPGELMRILKLLYK